MILMTWTNTGGGDHAGDDWTPANALTISGVHTNIGTFTVTTGYTINLTAGSICKINAGTISVVGTINGNAKGGVGSGGSSSNGGGGGGYGGTGATGMGPGGGGGGVRGNNTLPNILMGGNGGVTDDWTTVGIGGGAVILRAHDITISGTLNFNGGNGSAGPDDGTGGGSGGGILIIGLNVTLSGAFNMKGGSGLFGSSDGGAGGGGRMKVFAQTLDTTGITHSEAAGPGYNGGAVAAAAGTYNTYTSMGQCTASLAFGQTIKIDSLNSILTSVTLNVRTSTATDDFTLKVWDSTAKSTEYTTKTENISSIGAVEFTFTTPIRLESDTTYYIEVNPDAAGDCVFDTYGAQDPYANGTYYYNLTAVDEMDAYMVIDGYIGVKSAVVYNTADTTVKSNLTNLMLVGAIHRINSDNTGTVQYADDFSTNKYLADYTALSGVTYDTINNELDIADGGYIYYLLDTKYPVTGIPTLTAQINVTVGTPTIQISSDATTWYDIDTVVVDDVSTIYDLDNAANLSLKGLTTFYLRFDCGGAGTNTCSIKTFTLDVDIVTIDVPNPVINTGAANTFKCEQDSDSGLNCEVELIYRDRKWT